MHLGDSDTYLTLSSADRNIELLYAWGLFRVYFKILVNDRIIVEEANVKVFNLWIFGVYIDRNKGIWDFV